MGGACSDEDDTVQKTASLDALAQYPDAIPASRSRRHTVAGSTHSLRDVLQSADLVTLKNHRPCRHEGPLKLPSKFVLEANDAVPLSTPSTPSTPSVADAFESTSPSSRDDAEGEIDQAFVDHAAPSFQGGLTPRTPNTPRVSDATQNISPACQDDAEGDIGQTFADRVASAIQGGALGEETSAQEEISSRPSVGKKRRRIKQMLTRAFGKRALQCFDHRR